MFLLGRISKVKQNKEKIHGKRWDIMIVSYSKGHWRLGFHLIKQSRNGGQSKRNAMYDEPKNGSSRDA
jgi:hypothetical protein